MNFKNFQLQMNNLCNLLILLFGFILTCLMADILIVLKELIAVGRTKSSYKLEEKNKMLINQQFSLWLYKSVGYTIV